MFCGSRATVYGAVGLFYPTANHVVLAANSHSECERFYGSRGVFPLPTQTGAMQSRICTA